MNIIDSNLAQQEEIKRLRLLYPANSRTDSQITEEALTTYAQNKPRDLRNPFKGFGDISSTRFFVRYINNAYYNNLYVSGLSNFLERKKSFLDSYKRELEESINKEKRLKRLIYENKKKRNEDFVFYKRINTFEQEDLSRINTLKHPEIIGYYFNLGDLCEIENNFIRLPSYNRSEVRIKTIKTKVDESEVSSTNDPIENIKTDNTSYQQIYKCKAKKTTGVDQVFIIEFCNSYNYNEIEITDASFYKTNVKEIYYKNSDEEKVLVSYREIEAGNKRIFILNKNISKRLYIKFNQKNYIDLEQTPLTTAERIINANRSSFDFEPDPTYYYYYEINIDRIKVYNRYSKKVGVFKLRESFDVADYTRFKVNLTGISLENLDISIFIEKFFQDGSNTYEEIEKISINESTEIEEKVSKINVMLILEEKGNELGTSSLIESIDIWAS